MKDENRDCRQRGEEDESHLYVVMDDCYGGFAHTTVDFAPYGSK